MGALFVGTIFHLFITKDSLEDYQLMTVRSIIQKGEKKERGKKEGRQLIKISVSDIFHSVGRSRSGVEEVNMELQERPQQPTWLFIPLQNHSSDRMEFHHLWKLEAGLARDDLCKSLSAQEVHLPRCDVSNVWISTGTEEQL